MEILKVQNLCKTYGKGEAKVDALKNVSFSLNRGEFAAVVGESGSGKSTLLNCVGALDSPTSGHILVDGQDLFSMKEEQRTIFRRRNIGFIFQSFQLVSELNVEQNIMFPLLLDYRKPDPAAVNEICRKTLFPNFRLAISLLDRSLQEEIKKGTIRPVKAEDLMVSAISLNIFVFVANPLIQLFVEEKGEEYHQYMERRKQENVEIILSRLRI